MCRIDYVQEFGKNIFYKLSNLQGYSMKKILLSALTLMSLVACGGGGGGGGGGVAVCCVLRVRCVLREREREDSVLIF